jgi:hypothetical protein
MRYGPHKLAKVPESCGWNAVVRGAVRVLLAHIAEQVGYESWIAAESEQDALGDRRGFGLWRSRD